MNPSDSSSAETDWATLTQEYEGFPLYLRFPRLVENEAIQARFPVVLVLTHTFNFRQFGRASEPTYNDTLGEFNSAILTHFERDGLGLMVLVETFGGRRNYYFYVQPAVDLASVLQSLRARFPACALTGRRKEDPTWQFIRQCRSELGF